MSSGGRPSGLMWEWSPAALGALYALPGAIVVLDDRSRGLALAVGVLPAAIIGLAPTRRGRLATVVLGTCVGVPMFVGGLMSGVPVIVKPDIPGGRCLVELRTLGRGGRAGGVLADLHGRFQFSAGQPVAVRLRSSDLRVT